MIDEWREAVAGGASNLRLHIFVQVTCLSADGFVRCNTRASTAWRHPDYHLFRQPSSNKPKRVLCCMLHRVL